MRRCDIDEENKLLSKLFCRYKSKSSWLTSSWISFHAFVRALCALIKRLSCTVQAAVYGAGWLSLLLSYSPAILSMSLVPGQKSSKKFSRARSLHFTLISTKPGIKLYKYFTNYFGLTERQIIKRQAWSLSPVVVLMCNKNIGETHNNDKV